MSEKTVALKEKINEMRAKRLGHSYEYDRALQRVMFHLHEQSKLDDDITAAEVELAALKSRQSKLKILSNLFTTK